jgi:DNA polymerase-3 subunit gamma/tau
MDVLEIDAASNRGIDEIRDLREKVRYAPAEVRQKVYIIDEVHMLTPEAFNALLKTLEEPPSHILFILATTEPHKLPATIVSRCQRLDFRLIGITEIADKLTRVAAESGIEADDGALHLIAEQAAGAMRDALSLLEQTSAYGGGRVDEEVVLAVLGAVGRDVYYDLTRALLARDLAGALLLVDKVTATGRDLHHFTQQAISYYRDLMVVSTCGREAEALGIAPQWTARLESQAGELGLPAISHILSVLHQLLGEIRWSARPRLMLEVALFRLFDFENTTPSGEKKFEPAARTTALPPSSAEAQPHQPGGGVTGRDRARYGDPEQKMSLYWNQVLEQVKKESVRTHAFLLDASPAFDGRTLQLDFNASFNRDMIEAPENMSCLETVACRVLGQEVTVRCRQNGHSGAADPAGRQELADSAAEIFNGKIVEERKKDREV